ncbi:TolC family outer membrane protein [Microvirga pudoricolor]|uniref:TolC family outer membrane protein n=1 Tax=Microvirga pudoricolor TaxID=2778729 RepID=UPI00194F1360|nr:TolC family outer membrane protein [Microvirga pudoricolor]MBM6594218.1 TolC family outer membrane protein [Microvirga pudoricolor]
MMTSVFAIAGLQAASAETLESALSRAYVNNPSLNATRAEVRSTDENVPRAKSGYRPRVNATADAGLSIVEGDIPASAQSSHQETTRKLRPRGYGVQVDQNLFNGFRTENSVRQAESASLGARETLRNDEQNTLFNSASSYMNVLRDTAILDLQRNNVEVIEEQLRQTRDRFNVGEVTRTDVAQAESRLAAARSQASLAEANLRTSIAVYRQTIGVEPRQLAPGRPLDRLLPRNVDAALKVAFSEHPAIKASLHGVDAAELQIKIEEGALAPTVGLSGSVANRFDNTSFGDRAISASATIQLSVPLYDGGVASASTRQAKETAGQRRLESDSIRDQVRAAVISSWGQLEAARAQILAAQAQVEASETALNGVREEARVGQRTTLDVLNAQQELLNARVNLITAQRDRVVASYAVVQASGRLNSRALGLNVAHYSAKEHFDQVKDLWHGLTTPDGR